MAQVSMEAADIGLPQLAMHSAYETAGAKDIGHLIHLAECFSLYRNCFCNMSALVYVFLVSKFGLL